MVREIALKLIEVSVDEITSASHQGLYNFCMSVVLPTPDYPDTNSSAERPLQTLSKDCKKLIELPFAPITGLWEHKPI